jgi:GTP-binding protein LepA
MRIVQTPAQIKVDVLRAGEVGFMSAAIKAVDHARVGDTITLANKFTEVEELPGTERLTRRYVIKAMLT